ncbi:App1 family protein [Ruania alba]|uniref:Phosphatidate phosphatase APP1 n=1 Tax=Ruania alba TaxID=648782 RepID=A0A1H5M7V3_9MICO|nr:phosphatase domain-containing protein [Ruania alba]SEE85382.1 Phosphatidate phosphatase APP1 [Ruania alba]
MSATHVAARFEDGFHRRLIPYLRSRGWLPRTIDYIGYGNRQVVRVLARVVLSRQPSDDDARLSALDLIERRGWRAYVTAPVSFIPVTVRVGGYEHTTVTDRSGYLDLVINGHDLPAGWHSVEIRAKAAAPAYARVRIIDTDSQLGIVSDIDDTALVTLVPRPFIALWNTFVRHGSARHVVPGMAQMYQRIAQEHPGTPMFYLSTGAWNIMPTLVQFLRSHAFPAGPMLMTDWGPTNTGWFRSGQEHKRVALRRLAAEFPHVRWVLVGDDGQHDPSIYREFAREYPTRVAAIAIRQLTPGEQVLAHGTPMPTVEPGEYRGQSPAPEITGADGFDLAPQLSAVLRAL